MWCWVGGKRGVWGAMGKEEGRGEGEEEGEGDTWDPRTSFSSRLFCGSGRRTGAY